VQLTRQKTIKAEAGRAMSLRHPRKIGPTSIGDSPITQVDTANERSSTSRRTAKRAWPKAKVAGCVAEPRKGDLWNRANQRERQEGRGGSK
jgi:hypothetical protein